MRLTHEGRLDGYENMRRDQELLDHAGSGVAACRLYTWDGIWVSVGRFQSVERDLVSPAKAKWVRRPTGGKAVLHGHDMTVSLAMPLSKWPNSDQRSIKFAYRATVQPLITAMRACGIDAVLAEESIYANSGSRSGDCFAFSSPNDVVESTSGSKLCGCALRLTQTAVLLQASIPIAKPLVPPPTLILNARPIEPVNLCESDFAEALETVLGVAW